MTAHYTFDGHVVTPHGNWISVLQLPAGLFFYSPYDSTPDKWGRLVQTGGRVWDSAPKSDMPKEFLLQLLLMGVPC